MYTCHARHVPVLGSNKASPARCIACSNVVYMLDGRPNLSCSSLENILRADHRQPFTVVAREKQVCLCPRSDRRQACSGTCKAKQSIHVALVMQQRAHADVHVWHINTNKTNSRKYTVLHPLYSVARSPDHSSMMTAASIMRPDLATRGSTKSGCYK